MKTYKNTGGDSGISGYEIFEHKIDVHFNTGDIYTYSYSSAGQIHIEKMKKLAEKGTGLNSYIMNNVRFNYESKR